MSQQNDKLAQNVFWISIGLMLTALFIEASIIFDAFNNNFAVDFTNWRLYGIMFLPIPLLIGTIVGAIISRRKKPTPAFYALLAGGLISVFIASLISDNSEVFTLIVVLGLVVFAAYVLPERPSRYAIITAVFIGISAILIDLWATWDRSLGAAEDTDIERIVAGAVVALLVIYALSQAKQFNLRTKLVLLFSVLPILIIGSIAVLLGLSFQSRIEQQLSNDALDNVSDLSTELTGALAQVEADVQFLGQSTVLSTYLTISEAIDSEQLVDQARLELNNEFLNFAQVQQIYDQVRFIDATGQEVIRINTDNGISEIVTERALSNKSGRYYFENTLSLNEGEIFISPLDLNVEQGQIEVPYQPVIRYGIPVVHNGEKKGIVIINVSADKLLERLDTHDGERFLIDTEGYYLFHSDETKQWSRDLNSGFMLENENPMLASSVFGKGSGTIQDDLGLYVHQPVVISDEQLPRWFVVEMISNEFVVEQIEQTFSVIQTIASITVLLAPLIGLVVSQTISVPVTELTKSAEQVAAGNLNVEIKVRGNDEISTLASTFKMMTQQLRQQVGGLEIQAAERTRDLTLAAEISLQISHLRDLDKMLQRAVELIQERYDLYYVQVYLVAPEGKYLTMQAGTGEIGSQLQQRNFQLPINADSINGMAVANKKSIIVSDTKSSAIFRPNPLLPETRSEAAVPLLLSEKVVGVLDMQSDTSLTFSEETRPVFEVLAGQLAVAINNARLYQEMEMARDVIESQAQTVIKQAWDEFLDGINNQRSIRYRYRNNTVQKLTEPMAQSGESIDSIPISIVGELIGALSIQQDEGESLSKSDEEFLTVVANQVAQRIDSLRLLSESERFRLEAEEIAKRLVRDSWQDYQTQVGFGDYQYDQNLVQQTVVGIEEELNATISAPLDIRGEMIGQLFLEGIDEDDENAYYLIGVIADQLSTHIENLRLSQQTEIALAESQRQREELGVINQIASSVAAQLETKLLLESVLEQLKRVLPTDSFIVALYDSKDDELSFKLVFDTNNGYQYDLPPTKLQPEHISSRIIQNKKPELIHFTEEEVEAQRQERPPNLISEDASITASLMFAPMIQGDEVIGVISLQSYEVNAYSQSDLELITSVASYVTTGIRNAQLFSEIQKQSEKERIINVVTQKIQGTLDVESALQTAVSELGNMLQASYTQVTLKSDNDEKVDDVSASIKQPQTHSKRLQKNGTHS